jgi:hypothetical protein
MKQPEFLVKSAEMFVKSRDDVVFQKLLGVTLKNVIAMFWDTAVDKSSKGVCSYVT